MTKDGHFSRSALSKIAEEVKQLLLQASPLVLEYFEQEKNVLQKQDNSWVTEADMQVEKFLHKRLAQILPEAYFLGEESASLEQQEIDQFFSSPCSWAIDPIDGTSNFLNHLPLFAVSIGLWQRTKQGLTPCLGALLFPANQELIYHDAENVYLYHLKKQQQRKVYPYKSKLDNSAVISVSDSFYRRFQVDWQKTTRNMRQLGCTVADILYVAMGRSAGTYTRSRPWDFTASLSVAHQLGVNFRNLNTGAKKVFFQADDFILDEPKENWRLKDVYVVSHEENFSVLQSMVTSI